MLKQCHNKDKCPYTQIVQKSLIDNESRDWVAISCGCRRKVTAILADADARDQWSSSGRQQQMADFPPEVVEQLNKFTV